MGIYLCDEPEHADYDEIFRQNAVERAAPMRLRDDERLKAIVQDAAFAYDSMAAITIINWRKQIILAGSGITAGMTEREDAICDVTIQRPGEMLIVADARVDPRLNKKASVLMPPYVRFYAGVSINNGAGYALGALCVFRPVARLGGIDTFALNFLARQAEKIICP